MDSNMNMHYLRTIGLTIILLTLSGLTLRSQPLPTGEQERLKKAYDLVGRSWSLSADLMKKLDDEAGEVKAAIGDVSDIFTIIDVLSKVSEAKDFEAFEAIVLFIEDKLLSDMFEDIFPNASSALNWAGKARAMMQLLIDFVINPALLDNEIDQYIARREIPLDPDDAVTGIRSWGNIKQQLLGEFRKQYGDLPFREIKPSGMFLLPAWDRKFDDYVTGWFEEKYQEHKIKEFNAIARRELANSKARLEEKIVWLEYLIEKELESTEKLTIEPSATTVKVSESVTFRVIAVNFKGEAKDVTAIALANPVFNAVTPGMHSILAQYDGKDALARVTVEEETAAPDSDDQDNPPPPPEGMCDNYSNTEPNWDPGREEYYCDCLPGYLWRPDLKGCEEEGKLLAAHADCSGYPNTQPVWDDVSKTVICDCLPGYVWDQDFTRCYPQSVAGLNSLRCDAFPNTMPVWDPERQQPYCDCIPGYRWRDDFSGCDRITATQIVHADCSHIPNAQPVYDPVKDIMVCDCMPGFVWNNSYTGCVPERKKPAIDMNDIINFMAALSGAMNNNTQGVMTPGNLPPGQQQPVVHQSRCNDTQKAGGDAPEVHMIDLGIASGAFRFDYQTFDVKDQIIISQGGMIIFNSGCVGESRSVQVPFSGYTTVIEVRVNPNCSGSKGTAWNFTVHCPSF
jgi:hypothetical protein